MPGESPTELYFIAAMMLLTLLLCAAAVYFFVKTYRKEMREKAKRLAQKEAGRAASENTRQE